MSASEEMKRLDWEALIAIGYHCEVGGDSCVYRPAPHWLEGHPCCTACFEAVEKTPASP